MTFLELSVVICVLLALLGIFFIGVRAWRKSSDRTANILNIRNVQQAVRSYSNSHALAIGTSLAETVIVGPDKYLAGVYPPNDTINYIGRFNTIIPPIGTLYLIPSYTYAGGISDFAPLPDIYTEW